MALVLDGNGPITGLSVGGLPAGVINSTNIVDATIAQGDLDTSIIPIGVGQTWQNLLSSRAIGTNYTNSTGRPIMVCVSAYSFNAACDMTTAVGGVTTNWNRVSDYYTASLVTPSTQTTSFIVPNGAVYNVGQNNGTVTLYTWAELR